MGPYDSRSLFEQKVKDYDASRFKEYVDMFEKGEKIEKINKVIQAIPNE